MTASTRAFNITPSDTVPCPTPTVNGIYVGGTGNITAKTLSGGTVLISSIPVGTVINVCITQIFATGTSATLIVGFAP